MGAGAGYTIRTKDVEITGKIQINTFDVVEDKNWLITTVDCNVPIEGSIQGESYMYSFDWINRVPMTVTSIVINFYKTDEYPDVTTGMIQEVLENTTNYEGECLYGGGWVHSTFEGDLEIESWSNPSYTDDIHSVSIMIEHKNIIDFIDLAVSGENVEYHVCFNDDFVDVFSGIGSDDEAIDRLKELIREEIKENGIDDIDFSNCYVEEFYWTEDVDGNMDIVTPWYDNIMYNAYDDYDEFEELAEHLSEVRDEIDPDLGVDEDFDI